MSQMLDLTKGRREYLRIKLDDVGVLNIAIPTKHLFDELMDLLPDLKKLNAEDSDEVRGIVATLYELIAEALSSNREGKTFKPDEVEQMLDLGAAFAFMNGYLDFVNAARLGRGKN